MKKRIYEVIEIQDYIIEIYKDKVMIETWIYRKNYGVKMFCIGIERTKNYKDIINRNIIDWIDTYKELYEEGEF